MLHVVLILACLCVLGAIAWQDAQSLQISHLGLAVLTVLATAALLTRPEPAVVLDVVTGLGLFALGVVYWAQGWMGGGDAKLFLPVGLMLGRNGVLTFALGLTIAALIMHLIWRRRGKPNTEGVPFAVPVFFAALATVLVGFVAP